MKKATQQQDQLRTARKRLNATTAELAAMLGKSEAALLAWLAPESAAKHRTMPAGSRMLLERILAEHRAKGRRK